MMPFDNLVTTRLAAKDSFRPCIPKPLSVAGALPLPLPAGSSQFGSLDTGALSEINASVARAAAVLRGSGDLYPAAEPNTLGAAYPAPLA